MKNVLHISEKFLDLDIEYFSFDRQDLRVLELDSTERVCR